MRRAAFVLPFVTLWIAACGGSPIVPDAATLNAAPTSATLGGKSLALTATVTSPVVTAGNVAALVQIKTSDGSQVPANVVAQTIWLIAYDTPWTTPIVQ